MTQLMRVRAPNRNAEELSGEHVRGRRAPADVRGARLAANPPSAPCARRSPNSITGSPCAARQTRAALVAMSVWKLMMLSSAVSTSCACSDGPRTRSERLLRKDDRAFRDRIEIAAPLQGTQIFQKRRVEERCAIAASEGSEVSDLVIRERERIEKVDRVTEPARHAEAASERALAKDEMKDRLLVLHAIFPIPIRHRELVKIGEQRRAMVGGA